MKIQNVMPGKYVVAVSGGVDSMVLLDLLAQKPHLQLVIAHFDHGMRPDASADRQFVQAKAERLGLVCVFAEGKLGARASEATARAARYAFLRNVQAQHGAVAIITAHHQDDMLETAIINMLRGTGRKGLSALQSTSVLIRPLLGVPKQTLIEHAHTHHLQWREDQTNTDIRYLRNYIRRQLLPQFSAAHKLRLLEHVQKANRLNREIDHILADMLQEHVQDNQLDRRWFIQLPQAVSTEVIATWLRESEISGFDKRTIARLVVVSKTARAGTQFDVKSGVCLLVAKTTLTILVKTT